MKRGKCERSIRSDLWERFFDRDEKSGRKVPRRWRWGFVCGRSQPLRAGLAYGAFPALPSGADGPPPLRGRQKADRRTAESTQEHSQEWLCHSNRREGRPVNGLRRGQKTRGKVRRR